MAAKRSRKPFRSLVIKVAVLAGAVLVAGTAAWFAANRASRAAEEKRRLAAFDNLTANVVERIAELAVLEYRYTDVMELQKKFIIGGQSSSLVRFSGVVKAGIADVSAVNAEWDRSAGTVTLALPRSSIVSNEVDVSTIKIWDLKRNLFVPITTDFKIQEIAAFRDKVASELEATGFLDEADSRAEEVLGSLFAGFGNVTVDRS